MHTDDKQTWDVKAQFGWLTRSGPLIVACGLGGAFLLASVLSYGTGSILSKPSPTLILYPAFALFVLVFIVLSRMGEKRIGGVVRGELNIAFYRTFSVGEEPEQMQAITRNFINLFEMPVLFYVGIIFTYITQQVTYW
ncbi:MAG: MAPEG family protein, partial [Candidatus Binatia bacterium]